MKIRAMHNSGHTLSSDPYAWSAIDDDTYDGAEDSDNRHMVGYGTTRDEAIADLQRLLQEKAECDEPPDPPGDGKAALRKTTNHPAQTGNRKDNPMSVERNLPENRQRFLDGQVYHWEEVTRRVGSARDMLKLAEAEYWASPQATPQYVRDWFDALRVNLDAQLADAKRMSESAAERADNNQ